MSHPSPPSFAAPNLVTKKEFYGVVGILVGFCLILSLYLTVGTYGNTDESAYLLTGRQLARTHSPFYYSDNPLRETSEGMLETAPGVFVAKYPIGYPLLLAFAYGIGGTNASFWVNPLCAIVFLIAAYAIFRFFLKASWALLALAVLAFHPIVIYYATGALSHMADIAAATAALAIALRWSCCGDYLRAVAAGLLLGIACSIRATDILLLMPMSLLAVQRWSHLPGKRRHKIGECATFFGALLVGVFPTLYFQWLEFGSPFTSGYHFTHEDTAFSVSNFSHHFPSLLWALNYWGEGLPIVFPAAVLGLGYLAFRRRIAASFLILWIIPILVVYCAYFWITADSPRLYLRFYLILYPAFVLAIFFVLQTMSGTRRLTQHICTALFIAFSASQWFPFEMRHALDSSQLTGIASAGAAIMIQELHQPDAAVFCDFQFALFQVYATDNPIYSVEWFTTSWAVPKLAKIGSSGVLPIDDFRAKRLRAALGDPGDQVKLNALLIAEIGGLQEAKHPVYLLTNLQRIAYWNEMLPGRVVVPSNIVNPQQFALFPILP